MTDKLVAVGWDDANVQQENSYTRDEIRDFRAPRYVTFGLLVRNDDLLVSVASECCDDNTYRGVTNIPRGMVREIIPLGRWPKRPRKAKPATTEGRHDG